MAKMVQNFSLAITVVSQKRAHYGLSAHPPILLLLRSKIYLKERPPSAYRDFPLASKPEDVVRLVHLVYTHYNMHITLLLLYTLGTRCLAHDVTH